MTGLSVSGHFGVVGQEAVAQIAWKKMGEGRMEEGSCSGMGLL